MNQQFQIKIDLLQVESPAMGQILGIQRCHTSVLVQQVVFKSFAVLLLEKSAYIKSLSRASSSQQDAGTGNWALQEQLIWNWLPNIHIKKAQISFSF